MNLSKSYLFLFTLLSSFLLLNFFPKFLWAANTEFQNVPYTICFTPQENCTAQIVSQIKAAQKSIFVQAYSLTSRPIIKALIQAAQRGVSVNVIVDKSQFDPRNHSQVQQLIAAKIPVWKDYQLDIAHNKVMIFDSKIVETGSFNYTYAAQKYNAENVLIIQSPDLAASYFQNWQIRKQDSKSMDPAAD